jgi:hypothetical protein
VITKELGETFNAADAVVSGRVFGRAIQDKRRGEFTIIFLYDAQGRKSKEEPVICDSFADAVILLEEGLLYAGTIGTAEQ